MPIPVETLSYIGVMAVMLGIMWKLYDKITSKHSADIKEISAQCGKIQNRLTIVETKQDIYLHGLGYDVREVNSEIKKHIEDIEELKNNGGPTIGCLDVEKLKRRQI